MLNTPVNALSLGLPVDIWMLIAKKLNPADLNHFIRAVQLFKSAGMRFPVLKETCDELYARLYAMDASLPPTLRTADFIGEYQAAFKTVEKSLKRELALLRQHYPQIVNEAVAIQAKAQLENPNLTPLQRLEQTHQTLDNINIAIIRPNIQPLIQPIIMLNQTELTLNNLGITRFPQQLMQDPHLKAFFDQLESIDCKGNHLKKLDIENLPLLKRLNCNENKLKKISIADTSELVVPENYETNEDDCLDIRFNRFETIPQYLVDKFGQAWAEKMLRQQGDKAEEPDEEMGDEAEQPQPDADMTEISAAAQPTLLIQHKRHSDDEISEKSEHQSDHEDLDDLEDSHNRVFKWRR